MRSLGAALVVLLFLTSTLPIAAASPVVVLPWDDVNIITKTETVKRSERVVFGVEVNTMRNAGQVTCMGCPSPEPSSEEAKPRVVEKSLRALKVVAEHCRGGAPLEIADGVLHKLSKYITGKKKFGNTCEKVMVRKVSAPWCTLSCHAAQLTVCRIMCDGVKTVPPMIGVKYAFIVPYGAADGDTITVSAKYGGSVDEYTYTVKDQTWSDGTKASKVRSAYAKAVTELLRDSRFKREPIGERIILDDA